MCVYIYIYTHTYICIHTYTHVQPHELAQLVVHADLSRV